MDKSMCTVCTDFLTYSDTLACPCGHTFHSKCIFKWKEQSATCPQCRKRFKDPIKLYFELSREDRAEEDPADLRNQMTELNIKLRVRDSSIATLTKEKKAVEGRCKEKAEEVKNSQHLLNSALGTNEALKKQLTYMDKFKIQAKKSKDELAAMKKKSDDYQGIQGLIDTNSHDIEKTLQSYAGNPDSLNQITMSYVFFKKEFERLKESKRNIENDNKNQRKKAESCSRQLKVVTNDLKKLDEENKTLTLKVSELVSSNMNKSAREELDAFRQTSMMEELKRENMILSKKISKLESRSKNETGKRLSTEESDNSTGKRQCLLAEQEEFEVIKQEENDDPFLELDPPFFDRDPDEQEAMKIADEFDEFGLEHVATTSLVKERLPLKDISKRNKNSFASSGMRPNRPGYSCRSEIDVLDENPQLPHFKRGFNGMGGQTKTLVIPKRTSSFVKQTKLGEKKSSLSSNRIPKNNYKITKFTQSIDLT